MVMIRVDTTLDQKQNGRELRDGGRIPHKLINESEREREGVNRTRGKS